MLDGQLLLILQLALNFLLVGGNVLQSLIQGLRELDLRSIEVGRLVFLIALNHAHEGGTGGFFTFLPLGEKLAKSLHIIAGQ